MRANNTSLVILAIAILMMGLTIIRSTDDRFRGSDFAREIALRDAQIKQLIMITDECRKLKAK